MDYCSAKANFYDRVLVTDKIESHPNYKIIHPKTKINHHDDVCTWVTREMTDCFDSPHVLAIGWDGFIVNPDAWEDTFLTYDYIGARWTWIDKSCNVGNGGFALRSKRMMDIVKDQSINWNILTPEDQVTCQFRRKELESFGIKFAPEEVALRFSIENEPYNNQFGFHARVAKPSFLDDNYKDTRYER